METRRQYPDDIPEVGIGGPEGEEGTVDSADSSSGSYSVVEKKVLTVIVCLITLLAALVLLAHEILKTFPSQQNSERQIAAAKGVYDPNVPKVLEVYLLIPGIDDGAGKRYYDFDGDGKTVEQYVEFYTAGLKMPMPKGVKKNLLRKGATPWFNADGSYCPIQEMTSEEMETLDQEYQTLLASQTPR